MSCPQIKSYTDKCLWNGNLPNNHLRPDRTLWQRNTEFFVKVYVILRFYAFLRYTLAIKRLFFRQSLRAWSPWLQIPVSRAFKAASRECKQVSIPLDLHLKFRFIDLKLWFSSESCDNILSKSWTYKLKVLCHKTHSFYCQSDSFSQFAGNPIALISTVG